MKKLLLPLLAIAAMSMQSCAVRVTNTPLHVYSDSVMTVRIENMPQPPKPPQMPQPPQQPQPPTSGVRELSSGWFKDPIENNDQKKRTLVIEYIGLAVSSGSPVKVRMTLLSDKSDQQWRNFDIQASGRVMIQVPKGWKIEFLNGNTGNTEATVYASGYYE